MADTKLVRGTMILTASIFISKILGLIYIFPFKAIVGLEGLALYTYGYVPYTVFLSIATLGIPLAVSKFVSKYNALGDYHTGRQLFKSGLIVMSITGLVAFLALFLLAEPLAYQVVNGKDLKGNSIDDVILTIRMVSTALLIVPVMSIIRGFFQGHESMGPTAASQVVEQTVRIVFILSLTLIIVNLLHKPIGLAVGFATFGAFVGALGGLAVLLVYWFRRKHYLNRQLEQSKMQHNLSYWAMYKELITYALPITFVGIATPLYQTIDLLTFNKALMAIGYDQNQAEAAFGAFAQAAHKLILIPVSLATALSLTIMPAITKSFVENDEKQLDLQITQTFQIILFLTIPASIGLSLLAYPAYGTLFGIEDMNVGAQILKYYAPVALLFSLFIVTSAILQGINQQRYVVVGLTLGLVIKLSLNSFLISHFEAIGAIIATAFGYLVSITINVWVINKMANYNNRFVLKRTVLILSFAALMGILVYGVKSILVIALPLISRFNSFIVLSISIVIGVGVYLYLGVRSGLAGQVLGTRFRFLKKKKLNR